jgi:hypothetical protein
MPNTIQTLEKMLKKTVKVGDCLIRQGVLDKDGYSLASINRKKMPGHRAAFKLANPDLDMTDLCVLHKLHCTSRACINPEHLYLGTKWDNCQDQIALGTFVKGELNGKALVTEKDVIEIRNSTLSTRELATQFNVSYHTIWDIRKGRSWKHLR